MTDLYWPVGEGDPPSPFGPFLAEAGVDAEQRVAGAPYYSYRYRIMTGRARTYLVVRTTTSSTAT